MKLIIIGAGGYGQTVADVARQLGRYESIDFLDDNLELKYTLGKCSDYIKFADSDIEMYPAFGNNAGRLEWINKLKDADIAIPTLVHPTAYISPSAMIGEGTVILPQTIINTDSHIGEGCIINCGAIIDHGCIIEEGCHICLGAIVKAENRICRCTKIEAGEVIQMRAYPV